MYNVFTEKANKIAFSFNDDKRLQKVNRVNHTIISKNPMAVLENTDTSFYHAYKQMIILYLNQGLLVKWQCSIIGTLIRMLLRNYFTDSKHTKPK